MHIYLTHYCTANMIMVYAGDEGAKADIKAAGDDVPPVEPVDDTHSSSVTAADNIVQAEQCVDDTRQEQLLPPAASLADVASPVPDHSPVPVTSPAQSPSHSAADTPPPSPPPSVTAVTTNVADVAETNIAVVQGL